MSQLVVRPGRNAAREAKRLKDIRKVKAAIQWHKQAREKRQKMKHESWQSKDVNVQRMRLKNEQVTAVRRQMMRDVREDWLLGPLRPNRAVGGNAEKYAALTSSDLQKTTISAAVMQRENAKREKRGQELEYPLVVDDKKYFPIVKGDRAVIIRGRSKNRFGEVLEVLDKTHEIRIKHINIHYFDPLSLNSVSQGLRPRHPAEVPIAMADVRLMIPYDISHQGQKRYRDVIVDKIVMERHTTGIDPYTGTDYGDDKIPEEHQNDPQTGLPIFHRYVAGTRHRIPWPWEPKLDLGIHNAPKRSTQHNPTWLRRTLGTIRHPITSLRRWRGKDKEIKLFKKKDETKEQDNRPRSEDPEFSSAYDLTDTTRNIVEAEHSMAYSIISPPIPETLGEELRDEIRDMKIKLKKDSPELRNSFKSETLSERGRIAQRAAVEKRRALEKMKTPLQLRWELEHAKKVKQQKENPLVDMESLLAALGQHMQKSNVKIPAAKALKRAEEVD